MDGNMRMTRNLHIGCCDCPAEIFIPIKDDFSVINDLVMVKVCYGWGGGSKIDWCPDCYKEWQSMVFQ